MNGCDNATSCHLAGGSKLPYGDRQSIDQRGIVRIHSVRKEDEGIYRCVATNGRGEKRDPWCSKLSNFVQPSKKGDRT
ncbi:hypothetical protein CEXT_353851 [Caerostris extrusa]|uniref:Immunoglobulin I-set domain-containing protein n=1 Tax=Caerostris extrusa TaxID=172846 RepID=A0AAV4X1G5_CAEEX|nr:hypothetical protein CEXT_353851 [Caerostris extrusa]